MNKEVEKYLNEHDKWKDELLLLRKLIVDCGLTEEWKWKVPCYTFNSKNVTLFHGFKEYVALSFFKGALLKDSEGILIRQTENLQAGRQIRFTNSKEIVEKEATLKAYIYEAIEVEKAGLQIEYKETKDFAVPEELQDKFKQDSTFKTAFEALTPGRQKGYLLHFAQAKQAVTRAARIEKYQPRILNGKGLNDCVCGLSKRMPNCDGSHKHISSTKNI